jgi:hypothetical protein
MQLDVRGHPLHTRALGVTLAQGPGGRLVVDAALLDLRKRGFVPVAGDLQPSGIVHHMLLAGIVDPATATLEAIVARQPTVAFEPSATTRGETCRDPIAEVESIAGSRLDAGFARRISAAIGGPRGCSHLVTLAHLLGTTAALALERDRALHGVVPGRAEGQRVYRRDVSIDGHELAPTRLLLAAQLGDLHLAPGPALAPPMRRFAGHLEVRALVEVDLAAFGIAAISAAERSRGPADLATAQWRDRADAVAPLVGLGLGAGVTAELLRRLGPVAGDRPLLDLLLMLAPALIQCSAALSEPWALAFRESTSMVGMGGLPDSCYMWRRGGALGAVREEEGGTPPRRV